jgi:hypothetical protein
MAPAPVGEARHGHGSLDHRGRRTISTGRPPIRRTELSRRANRNAGRGAAGRKPRRDAAPPAAAARAAGGIGGGYDCITQDELRRYHDRKAELRRLTEEGEAQRADLIQRLADHVPVAPGPYRASLHTYLAQTLTTTKLREVLGDAEVERLKEEIAPTPRIDLFVTLAK